MMTKPFFAIAIAVALVSFSATSTGAFASGGVPPNKSDAALGAVAASYPAVVASLKLGDAEAALKEEAPPWLSASPLPGPRKGRRPFGFPLGICQPGCSSPVDPCPGFSCPLWPSDQGSSNCTRVFYPGSKATRSSTNCLPDFRRDCATAAAAAAAKGAGGGGGKGIENSGCVPCALWHLVSTKCAPFSPPGQDTNADDCAIVAAPGLAGSPGFEANSTAIWELTGSTGAAATPATKPKPAPLQAAAKAAAAALAFSLGEPFAVIPSRERESGGSSDQPRLCLTRAQIMVVPARTCTGVEDDRAECTGDRAEAFWEAAWLEALAAGFPASPYGTNNDGGGDGGGVDKTPKPTWAAVVNPSNRRSQHQTHVRVSPWSRDDRQQAFFGDVLPRWLATPAFSLDPARPTLTAPERLPLPPDPSRPGEVQSPLIATVFVPLLSASSSAIVEKGMGWARPWATASVVAAAADNATTSSAAVAHAAKELGLSPFRSPLSPLSRLAPFVPGTVGGRPYGILVAPWAQEEEGGSGGGGTAGAAAAAAVGAAGTAGLEAAAATAAAAGVGGTEQTKKKKKLLRGFAVAATFDVGSTQLLDEQPTSDCFSRCAQWDNPGEKPALPLEDFAKLKKIIG